MKKSFFLTIIAIMIASCVVIVPAQKQKSKEELIKEVARLSNTKKNEDADQAYVYAQELLSRFGKDKDDNIKKIRIWTNNYRIHKFYSLADDKKTVEAFALGKQILAEDPDNTAILMNLAYVGYSNVIATQDKTYANESATCAQKALQLFEKGSFPKEFTPYKDKEEALAFLNMIFGTLTFDADMKTAVGNIYQATQYESGIKASSEPYLMIAEYYESVYTKLSASLNTSAKTMSETDLKAGNQRVNQAIDLMLDAYARAYKRAVAENNPNVPSMKQRLAQIYKFVKKIDVGLDAFVTYVNSTEMTDPSAF